MPRATGASSSTSRRGSTTARRRRRRAIANPQATDRRTYRVRIVFAPTGAIRTPGSIGSAHELHGTHVVDGPQAGTANPTLGPRRQRQERDHRHDPPPRAPDGSDTGETRGVRPVRMTRAPTTVGWSPVSSNTAPWTRAEPPASASDFSVLVRMRIRRLAARGKQRWQAHARRLPLRSRGLLRR